MADCIELTCLPGKSGRNTVAALKVCFRLNGDGDGDAFPTNFP